MTFFEIETIRNLDPKGEIAKNVAMKYLKYLGKKSVYILLLGIIAIQLLSKIKANHIVYSLLKVENGMSLSEVYSTLGTDPDSKSYDKNGNINGVDYSLGYIFCPILSLQIRRDTVTEIRIKGS